MKKIFLAFVCWGLLACSEEISLPQNSVNVKDVVKTENFREYNKKHKDLFEEIYYVLNRQDQNTKNELTTLLKFYQSNREEYESIVKHKLVSLLGEEKFKSLEVQVESLQKSAYELLNTEEYLKLSDVEKDELLLQLSYNLPKISQVLKSKGFLTKSASESQCLQDCADTRDDAIRQAAIEAMCGIGVGLAICLSTGGFGSVAGLIEAFLAAHSGDMAIENARREYERCIRNC